MPTHDAATLRLPPSRHPVPTRTRLRTTRIPLAAYAVVLLALPLAVLLGARATGWWVTDGHTVPATAVGAGAIGAAPTASAGADAAIHAPDDVKGSMTVQQVVDAFPGLTAADILNRFGAPASTPATTQLKTLAQQGNGFEVSDLREWLATRPAPR